MVHYRSCRSNQPIAPDELSTFRLDGVVKHMLGRNVVHLTKPEAVAFCRWLGFELHRPELETIPGPDDVIEPALKVRPPKTAV